jgi:hypothetical protein
LKTLETLTDLTMPPKKVSMELPGDDMQTDDKPLSQAAVETLTLLALHFERTDQPLRAAHCLMALLNSTAGARLLPDQEARIRLSLGRLLLSSTTSVKEALKELLRAVGTQHMPCAVHAVALLLALPNT